MQSALPDTLFQYLKEISNLSLFRISFFSFFELFVPESGLRLLVLPIYVHHVCIPHELFFFQTLKALDFHHQIEFILLYEQLLFRTFILSELFMMDFHNFQVNFMFYLFERMKNIVECHFFCAIIQVRGIVPTFLIFSKQLNKESGANYE